MVLIESESDDEINNIKEEPNQSRSSSLQPETTAATESKLVDGDDSDGFETASEREMSDNEGHEIDKKQDAITNQESQHLDKPEISDEGSKQEKTLTEDANETKLEGNKLFGNGFYEKALLKYDLALQFAHKFEDLRSICY